MNVVAQTGKFYGQLKTNIRRGEPPAGGTMWAQFTVGVYNFYKKNVEFFPCVAFGKIAERVVKLHGDKRWCSIQGELRQEKKEYKGRTYNEYKIQVWHLDVPLMDGENQTQGAGPQSGSSEPEAGERERPASPPPAAEPVEHLGGTTDPDDELPF